MHWRKRATAWDKIRSALKDIDLPPSLEKAARWVERHPRAALAGALVLVMAAMLAQTPAEAIEHDAYNGETPLFV